MAVVLRNERVQEAGPLRLRLLKSLLGKVHRLAPVRAEKEQQERLASPRVDRVAQRDDVADRLRHLLAGELEHPVVHPEPCKLVAERTRLRELVLVVREDKVEPAAVDLEYA